MKRLFLPCLLSLVSLTSFNLSAATKPNIVVIFIDDMGYADIGPFGATKQKTPALDQMAREGMKLTSFYAAPVCSVSRAQLLTGCYGARISVPGVFFPGQAEGLHPDEITIAERLKEQGYATACIGKWHLGDQPEFLPTRQGFDQYFGIPYSNDMQGARSSGGPRVLPLMKNDSIAEFLTDEQQRQLVKRYTDEAIQFIVQNQSKPFFLYLPHTAIHVPIYPHPDFTGKSANGAVGDWIEELDASTGKIMAALRERKLEKNTLVLFTSDNGPWGTKGGDAGSAAPLRGTKGGTYEGGVRVPTIAWWPDHIPAGTSNDTVAGTIDLLPTALTLAGAAVPSTPIIDGRDISSLLLNNSKVATREAHYYFSGYQLQAVRQGPWKLAIAAQSENMGQAPVIKATDLPILYNLEQDIGEKTNVAAAHPEIVAKLQTIAQNMQKQIAGPQPSQRRPAGKAAAPRTLYPMKKPNKNPNAKPKAEKGSSTENNQALQWTFTPDPKLPNVLILGDSISIGYTLPLRKELAGKANVFRPLTAAGNGPENCSGTTYGIANIDRWLAAHKWDVIHFNWGLHDLKHVQPKTGEPSNNPQDPMQADLETYTRQLETIVKKLEATGATLIFGTTTPVAPNTINPLREPQSAVLYNQAATKIMNDHKIAINDLHRFCMEPDNKSLQLPRNVHFTDKGSAKLATQVATAIESALKKK